MGPGTGVSSLGGEWPVRQAAHHPWRSQRRKDAGSRPAEEAMAQLVEPSWVETDPNTVSPWMTIKDVTVTDGDGE